MQSSSYYLRLFQKDFMKMELHCHLFYKLYFHVSKIGCGYDMGNFIYFFFEDTVMATFNKCYLPCAKLEVKMLNTCTFLLLHE